MMATLCTYLQILDEVLSIQSLVALWALDPQPLGYPAWTGRCGYRSARFLEPGHRSDLTRSRHVVPRTSSHVLHLLDELVEIRVAPLQIELRRLNDQQRCGVVVIEEVSVGLVELSEVVIVRNRQLVASASTGSRALAQNVCWSLQINDQIRGDDVCSEEVVKSLVNKQLVVVEIQVRIDFVFIEEVVANGELIKQIRLVQRGLLPMPGEHREQLALERSPRPAGVEIPNKWIVGFVQNDCGVESGTEVLRQCRLADAYRTLDGDIAEVQYTRQYSSPSLGEMGML